MSIHSTSNTLSKDFQVILQPMPQVCDLRNIPFSDVIYIVERLKFLVLPLTLEIRAARSLRFASSLPLIALRCLMCFYSSSLPDFQVSCPIYIVHVMSNSSADVIVEARSLGDSACNGVFGNDTTLPLTIKLCIIHVLEESDRTGTILP